MEAPLLAKIAKLEHEMKRLQRRIHNQRMALRENWMITEMRLKERSVWGRSRWLDYALKQGRRIRTLEALLASPPPHGDSREEGNG